MTWNATDGSVTYSNTVKGEHTVTITDAAAASVAITPTSPSVTTGGKINLTATVTGGGSDEHYDYKWTATTASGSASLTLTSGTVSDTIERTNTAAFTAGAYEGTVTVKVEVTRKGSSNGQIGTTLTDTKTVTVSTAPSSSYIYFSNGSSITAGSTSPTTLYVYPSNNLTGLSDYRIYWTTTGNVTISTSTYDARATSATTTFDSSSRTYVYVYATGSGSVRAQLYQISTGKYISDISCSVNNGSSFTITPTNGTHPTNQTVYLGYGYNWDYNGYTYAEALEFYNRYGYWPSWWDSSWNGNWNGNWSQNASFSVTPSFNTGYIASNYNISYSWTINNSNSSALSHNYGSSCTVYGSYLTRNTSYTLRCTATATPKSGVSGGTLTSNTLAWTIRTDYYNNNYGTLSASASVNQGDTYYLNSTNSYTSTSVIDQLNNQIRNYYGSSWSGSYNRYLSSITFTNTTSNGSTLSSSSGSYNGSSTSNFSNLYVTPTSSSLSSNSTATFSFRATDSAGYSYSGTLTITVRPGSTSASGFSLTGNQGENLVLSASDFSSWWRGLYSNGTLSYVQFTSVSGGNLYANYSVGGRSNVVSSTNATRCYVNPSSSQTGISSLTFVPSSSTTSSATLSFTAYGTTSSSSSSTVARTSTVSITLRTATVQNVSVRYSSTGGSVPFSYSDFYYSHTSVQTSSYITFGTPSNGSLTAGGSAVSTSTRFSFTGSNSNGYQSISTVTYTPASGYNGTATVPFYAYNTNGGVVANGTVYITVTQPAQPVTPSISFSDVPKNSNTSWYYDCVARLVSNKIVGGYPDGTFKPNGSVTNAEALKLIMLAAGYPSQPNAEANGVPGMWAANYLNAAINAGIVSSSEMKTSDLNKAINRNTIASITAKALKLTPVTDGSNSPFADSKDQWVLALNKAGIIQGTTEASGTTYFYGTQSLTRAQLCLIIERVMNYKQTGSAATPSTPSTPSNGGNNSSSSSNEKPGWLNT